MSESKHERDNNEQELWKVFAKGFGCGDIDYLIKVIDAAIAVYVEAGDGDRVRKLCEARELVVDSWTAWGCIGPLIREPDACRPGA